MVLAYDFLKAFLIVSPSYILTLFLGKVNSLTKQGFVGLFFLKILLGSF